MASVAEMAREEAERVEAEEEDEQGAGEPESGDDEDEDEEPGNPATEAIGPDEIKRAERAREAQRRKLAGILGDAYVAHECLFCSGLGYAPEPWPAGVKLAVVQGEDGLAFEVEAPSLEMPLLSAQDKAMCGECDGWGEVLSGSKASHGAITPCSRCAGNGWTQIARGEPTAPPYPQPDASGALPNVTAPSTGLPDAWGRPSGHQHWGVPPAMIAG